MSAILILFRGDELTDDGLDTGGWGESLLIHRPIFQQVVVTLDA